MAHLTCPAWKSDGHRSIFQFPLSLQSYDSMIPWSEMGHSVDFLVSRSGLTRCRITNAEVGELHVYGVWTREMLLENFREGLCPVLEPDLQFPRLLGVGVGVWGGPVLDRDGSRAVSVSPFLIFGPLKKAAKRQILKRWKGTL